MSNLFEKFTKNTNKTEDRKSLTIAQLNFWNSNGYLVLQSAITSEEREQVENEVNLQWSKRENNDHLIDILSGNHAGMEFRVSDISPSLRNESYKINNLFGRSTSIRCIALNKTIKSALIDLLDGEPMICNTLNFERGSQQPFHLDTWYMPPPVEGKMIAAFIAIDDIGPDNGPFIYYPGSHAIQPYYFSDGRLNIINSESKSCIDYLYQEIEKRGLSPETLSCKAGDVLLWHANLFHGGAPIKDMTITRKSLVVHYWRKDDIDPSQLRSDGDNAYLGRTLRGEIEF